MIFINGHPYKSYDIGPGLTVATNVSDGRNALGEFVGQRIGRDQDKIDGLTWTMMDAGVQGVCGGCEVSGYGKWRMENRTDVSGKPYGKYCSGGSSDGSSDGIQKLQG